MLERLSPDMLLAVLVDLAADDRERLQFLLTEQRLVVMLDARLRNLQSRPQSAIATTPEPLLEIASSVLDNPGRKGVTFRHSYIVERLSRLLPSDLRPAFYEGLVARIEAVPHERARYKSGGLFYIYIDASESAFQARQTKRAFQWCVTARHYADELPDNEPSAKARLAGTRRLSAYLCYTDQDRFGELVEQCHAELERETATVLSYSPSDGRLLQLQTALTRVELWKRAAALRLKGRITAFEACLRILQDVLTHAYRAGFSDQLVDVAALRRPDTALDGPEGRALGTVLVQFALAYAGLGDSARASWYATQSHTFELSARSRLDTEIAVARAVADAETVTRSCEEFLCGHVRGDWDALPVHHRRRALNQYSTIARGLSNLLKAEGSRSSAAYWRLQGDVWSDEAQATDLWLGVSSDSDDSVARPELLAERYATHALDLRTRMKDSEPDESPGKKRQRERQRHRVRRRKERPTAQWPAIGTESESASLEPPRAVAEAQHAEFVRDALLRRLDLIPEKVEIWEPGEIVTALWSVRQSPVLVIDGAIMQGIQRAVAAVVRWRPDHLTETASLLEHDTNDPGHAIRLALTAAADVARAYTPRRLPKMLLELSRWDAADADARIGYAQEAMELARLQGRLALEMRAVRLWLEGLTAADRLIDITDLETRLQDMSDRADRANLTLGISGASDLAFSLAAEAADLVETLARLDVSQVAFSMAAMAQGRVANAISENPYHVAELDDVIRTRNAKGREHLHNFYRSITTRISVNPASLVSPALDAFVADTEAGSGPGAAVIRYVRSSSDNVWVVGRDADGNYFSVRLPATGIKISGLAAAVWFWLRGGDDTAERDTFLRELYDVCLAPLRSFLAKADRVTFSFHGGLTFLPLHGALGPDGFFGARVGICYETPRTPAQSRLADHIADAAVFGWDASTRSDAEVRHLNQTLAGSFTMVSRPSAQAALDEVILNPDQSLAVLHISGHGHVRAFPDAMDSYIDLADGVRVTALEIMRRGCRARFVFLNVCGAGMHEVTAGDSYGFALAVRSRGAHAYLAPATYVAPGDAASFASLFYPIALRTNLTEAVRRTIHLLVDRGSSPAAWVPYALFGDLPALSELPSN